MQVLVDFYRSALGKKVIMALTGVVLIGFILGHMAGNMKMFAGIDPQTSRYKMDLYGEFLRSIGHEFMGHMTGLWIARVVLLLCVGLHILMAFQLAAMNRRARPVGYKVTNYRSSTWASRYMMIGGLIILAFVVFHILHFTTGDVHPNFTEGMVYGNVWSGFQFPLVVGFYLVAMLAISFHLYHGAWSLFQTFGVDSPRLNPALRRGAAIIAVVVFIGFTSVPLATYFGILKAPVGVLTTSLNQH